MIPMNRVPTHPGEVLLEEFLEPLGITQADFAGHIGISTEQVNKIVQGKEGVSPETAWLFAQAFTTTPEFWLNLQRNYDLATCRPSYQVEALVATL